MTEWLRCLLKAQMVYRAGSNPALRKTFCLEKILFSLCEDVRVVKETVSSSVVEKRKGSIPFPRKRGLSLPLTKRPPQFLGFCVPKMPNRKPR